MNERRITILGAGAVGGFLAALFWKNKIPVTCIVKPDRVDLLTRTGICLQSKTFGDFVAYPSIMDSLDGDCNILFVCTKATGLYDALDRVPVPFLDNGIILPLLNGIEHMDVLRGRFGKRVVAGSIGKVDVRLIGESNIVHSTPLATINIASNGDASNGQLSEVVRTIQKIGLEANLLKTEADVLWSKLVRLNALACTNTASNMLLGEIRSDSYWRKKMLDCVQEACQVAQLYGYHVLPQAVMDEIDRLPPNIGTSMQRDIVAGKPSELDAIAGAIVRAGRLRGVSCPQIEEMIQVISGKQTNAG